MLANLTLRRIFMVAVFFLAGNVLLAQKTISGTIKNAEGQPVVGATVTAKGTKEATQTNSDGVFSLAIPNGASKLTVSSVGFEPQEISIGAQTNVTATLKASTAQLSEVIVTALGLERNKKSLQF